MSAGAVGYISKGADSRALVLVFAVALVRIGSVGRVALKVGDGAAAGSGSFSSDARGVGCPVVSPASAEARQGRRLEAIVRRECYGQREKEAKNGQVC